MPSLATNSGDAGISIELSAADHAHPLPTLADIGIATQEEAETGTNNEKAMTSLRIAQVLAVNPSADNVARNLAASALAYVMAQNDATSITGNVGAFWLSDDLESDSLTTKTNATYDADGDYYSNPGISLYTPASGDWTGDTGEWTISSGALHHNTTGESGLKYTTQTFAGDFSLFFTTEDESYSTTFGVGATSEAASFLATGGGSYSGNTVGMTDSFWVSIGGGSGSLSAHRGSANVSSSFTTIPNGTESEIRRTGSTVTFHKAGVLTYTWAATSSVDMTVYAGSNADAGWSAISFTEPGTPLNMILAPATATLPTANPTDIVAYVGIDPQETILAGTDITMTLSIDGGTTETIGTWTKVGDLGLSGEEVWRIEADVSSQTGSSLTYKITTANNKEIRVKHVIGLVPLY